ncbi:Amidase [Gemmatirosa kalamazoonensis]|uniref:Amidase n=1 Tax=Gemmatirosa kalamazoonensis TaxID=861299 RepID=W0RG96_9BACT|nr:amidase [Gemmatirosa kalamazoonensis]AHG89796.1 Amidase [Gemmatirosa kalamazoonensis]
MSPTRREALAQLAALVALPATRLAAMASDPLDGTVADYHAGRRRGAWTAAEVTARALERCRRDGATFRAIDALADTALDEARAADARRRGGRTRGPLDGVPVFAKAIYDVAGMPTTGSSAEWARLFPEIVTRDALEVARLRAAGAVVLGKTAADDFAYHGNGTSSHTGQVLNPHDATGTRTPGGSSAGSAVAVATGMAFAALGTDDGGSNRIPAQFTGVVGMKPTFGLVPRTGVIPTWPYLDTHGPLARSVADAALLLAAIAGADPSDPLARAEAWNPAPLAHLRDDALAGARLGIVDAHVPRAQMTAEAVAMWDRALADLRAAGAVVDSFEPAVTRIDYRDAFAESARRRGDVAPDSRSPAPTANALLRYFAGRTDDARAAVRRGYAAYRAFYDVLPATFEACEPLLDRPIAEDPAGVSFARSRAAVVASLAASMRAAGVAAMVYPTMPFNAPRAVDPWPDVRTALGYGNWLGLPEVSVPAGLGADGMPALNLSVVGLPGDDARVLAFAHAYERQSRRFAAPPRR